MANRSLLWSRSKPGLMKSTTSSGPSGSLNPACTLSMARSGLKTHSKVALVVRREEHGLQTYTHISTGNYNPTTSRVYTDLGLLTSDSMIGDDAIRRVQLSDRLFDPERIQPLDGRAAEPASAHDAVDQARNGARSGGPARAHRGEDQPLD